MLMEWAVGKDYDMYRPNTGKLLLPGAQISWDVHIHAVGEEIRDHVELAVWLYPKGQEPKYRTYLHAFQARTGKPRCLDIPPNPSSERRLTVLKRRRGLKISSRTCISAERQCRWKRFCRMGPRRSSATSNFNFNWMTNYIYADDAAPVFPKGTTIHVTAWHDNTRANPNNPDPGPVGGLWRSHGGRDVPRVDERHLHFRGRLSGVGGGA